MAATSNLYQSIFSMVDKALNNYVQQGSARMIEFLVPVFTSMMIIWVAIWGYSLMFGRSEQPLQEGFYRILRIGFILTLGLTVGHYNQTVVRFLSETPQLLASVISGGHSQNAASLLDQLFSQIFTLADNAWRQGGVMDGNFGMYFLAIAVLLIGSCLTLNHRVLHFTEQSYGQYSACNRSRFLCVAAVSSDTAIFRKLAWHGD